MQILGPTPGYRISDSGGGIPQSVAYTDNPVGSNEASP